MRVKILRSIGTTDQRQYGWPAANEGDVIDVKKEVAEDLAKHGLVESVSDEHPPKAAKPAEGK